MFPSAHRDALLLTVYANCATALARLQLLAAAAIGKNSFYLETQAGKSGFRI
jgi:hypothetical protein